MKLIDTSVITPSAGYPGLGNNASVMVGLDFLQQAALDNATALSQSVASDTTQATILSGCELTSGNISAGWVYFGGEIFQVPAVTVGTAPVGHPFLNASWTANPTDTLTNQTILSDGTPVSMHNQRTIGFTWSVSYNAGNLPDFQQWIPTRMVTDEASITTINSEITTINSTLSTQAGEITTINSELTIVNASLSTIDPKGTIKMFGGTIAGSFDTTGLGISNWLGWAICNGNNTTPNLAGKFIAGFDQFNLGSDYGSIGNTGGEETHLLTDTESGLVSHTHSLTDPGHNHTVNDPGHIHPLQAQNNNTSGGGNVGEASGTNISLNTETASTGITLSSSSTGITANSVSASNAASAHENRPPYYVLAYVMKIV